MNALAAPSSPRVMLADIDVAFEPLISQWLRDEGLQVLTDATRRRIVASGAG